MQIIKDRWHYMDKILFFTMLFLIGLGTIEIQSAGSVLDVYEGSINYIFFKQVIIVLIGVTIFLGISMVPYRQYSWLSTLGLVALLLALVTLLFGTTSFNSSKSWITFGAFDIQPSEFGKLVFIMYLASFYNSIQDVDFKEVDILHLIRQPFLVFIVIFALIAMQPDPGTALVYAVIFAMTLLGNGLKIRENFRIIALSFISIAVIVFLLVMLNFVTKGAPEQFFSRMIDRLDYQEPCTEFKANGSKGYQVCNSMIAVNNGGLTGLGFNNSLQKHFYLPYAHTDSIIAIISEEFGFAGFTLAMFGYIIIFYKGLMYAMKTDDAMGSVICVGVVAMFATHLFINLLGNVGLGPLVGIPVPFLSYGGTFFVTSCIAMGMVQAVAIRYNRSKRTGKLDS